MCFDRAGNVVEPEGVAGVVDTGCPYPTFVVKPRRHEYQGRHEPVRAVGVRGHIDAVQAVDLTFDALINEVDVAKMRVFLSDVMFDQGADEGGRKMSIPFGEGDCAVFRKAMSDEDTIQEFTPALRTESQADTFRIALQMLGDLCGLGLTYFDFDNSGYVKTATEVSSDNSALMRNIRRHENALEGSLTGICRAAMACSRSLGEDIPDEGAVRVAFDDSIITDTAAEKAQDMAEVSAGLMGVWEYRRKWYGEDEKTARARAGELARSGTSGVRKSAVDGSTEE